MNKAIKAIGSMVLAAVLLQGSVFWGLEKWAAQAVNPDDHRLPIAKSQWRQLKVNTPLDKARQFSLSYKGEYLVWNDGDGFTVWDIDQERPFYSEKMPPGQRVALVQWMNDRNRLLLITEQSAAPVNLPAASSAKGKTANQVLADSMNHVDKRPLPSNPSSKQLEFSFLNADGGQRIFSTRIRGLTAADEVKEAVVSTQSNLLYLTLGDSRQTTALYRVDIQHEANKIALRGGTNVERLTVSPAQGQVYAEFWSGDSSSKPLVQGIKGVQLTSPAAGQALNYMLIGTDAKNNLYLGQGTGHQVQELWVWNGKKLEKSIRLPETAHRDRMAVGPEGQLVVMDEPKSMLKVYPKGSESPSVFSFDAGARLINSDEHFVGLLRAGASGGDLWLLSF
ncbi:hypothetical protein GTO89_00230 [Heliobacterium gestii]|uniref:WD40 repeat domain-containing protein n=1 Tax=Heliomicrobium gestii TaxID=2699 RepID=A0A845L5G9_HELGE|nr:hypothetical protein [Heliomicrobium gestii]MBM7865190.1 dipeptidyl aminopeptidase/acylaminoacyl peptidase [Heliomicrobium gestii]MZP41458.1 hypothetical protein [Heliomicrobium gestii]